LSREPEVPKDMLTGKLSVRLVCSILGNASEKPASIENGAFRTNGKMSDLVSEWSPPTVSFYRSVYNKTDVLGTGSAVQLHYRRNPQSLSERYGNDANSANITRISRE
jgi:hypothetical protein